MQSDTNEQNDLAVSFQQALRALNAGDFNAAEILFQQTLKRAGEHKSTAQMCLQHLSKMNQQRGNFDEAIRLSLRSLTLTKEASGEDSEQVVANMVRLAQLYENVGRYSEAGDLYTRANTISEKLVYSQPNQELDIASAAAQVTPEMSQRLREHFAGPSRATADSDSGNGGDGQQATAQQPQSQDEVFKFKENEEVDSRPSGFVFKKTETAAASGVGPAGRGNSAAEGDPLAEHKFQEENSISTNGGGGANKKGFSNDELAALSQRFRGGSESSSSTPVFKAEEEPQPAFSQSHSSAHNSKISSSRNTLSSDKIKNLRVEKEQADYTAFMRFIRQIMNSVGVQQLAWAISQFFRSRNNLIAAGLGLLVFLAVMVAWAFTIPLKKQPLEAYLSMPHKFRTTDGDVVIDLPEASRCDLTVDGSTTTAPMSCYIGDWREALRISLCSFFARQIYFNLEGKYLIDDDGTTFFPVNGKVIKLVNQMELISERASDRFIGREVYPQSVAELAKNYTEFENAFTDKAQLPQLQVLKMAPVASREAALAQLHAIYAELGKGGSWQGEMPLKPGALNCCDLTIPYQGGRAKAFLVQAGDEQGKALIGGYPNTHFFIALEDGKPADYDEVYRLETNKMAIRPRLIWIDCSADPPALIYVLLHTSALLFLFISTLLLMVLAIFRRLSRHTKALLVVAVTLSLFIAGIYFMENSFP